MILFNSLLKRHSNVLHNYVPGKTGLCGFKDGCAFAHKNRYESGISELSPSIGAGIKWQQGFVRFIFDDETL